MSHPYRKQGVVGAELQTLEMSLDYERAYITFNFYSSDSYDDDDLVTPASGEVTITESENGQDWASIENGTDMPIYTDYIRPNFIGHSKYVKAVPTAIAGATHWQLVVVRY